MSIKDIFPIDKWDFKRSTVLQNLPAKDRDLLMAHQTEQQYNKGEILFREGAFPSGIFYVTAGKIKKYKVDQDGREQIFYVANSGELLGYHALLSEERYPDFAAALEESRVAFIPKEDFLAALQQSDVMSKRLLKTLSHEFAVLANSISLFTQKSARERLALQLIIVREKYKEDRQPGMPVEINLSREDLANLVGISRENVVRLLTEFRELAILETRGRKIIVKDVPKLISLANYR